MDFTTMLNQIFQVCIIPLLGILTTYLVKLIKSKISEIGIKSNNELVWKYTDLLSQTISTCVIATNQTYVNSLKDKNAFTIEAQKEAFNMTLQAVLAVLSDDAKTYLTNIYGDLVAYITNEIEATVNKHKQ